MLQRKTLSNKVRETFSKSSPICSNFECLILCPKYKVWGSFKILPSKVGQSWKSWRIIRNHQLILHQQMWKSNAGIPIRRPYFTSHYCTFAFGFNDRFEHHLWYCSMHYLITRLNRLFLQMFRKIQQHQSYNTEMLPIPYNVCVITTE